MIAWIRSLFQSNRQKLLTEKISKLESDILELQFLSKRQSELLAAIAAIQCDVVSAVAGFHVLKNNQAPDLEKGVYVVSVDDDEFLN